MSASVLSYLNGRCYLGFLNETYIFLVPKVKDPKYIREFRPLSMCNVMYILISKILINKLQTVLSGLIDEVESVL